MLHWYLKAKHWQLFTVLTGGMILAQFATMKLPLGSPYFFVPSFLFGLLFFGWLWAIAKTTCAKLPPELSASPKVMGINLIYALSYMLVASYMFFDTSRHFPTYGVLLHLLAMIAILYSLGFTAKQLTKLLYRKNVSFIEYYGSFFLLWFFPVGVWFVQPKVNELLVDNENT
jgi:hypothetical protein